MHETSGDSVLQYKMVSRRVINMMTKTGETSRKKRFYAENCQVTTEPGLTSALADPVFSELMRLK